MNSGPKGNNAMFAKSVLESLIKKVNISLVEANKKKPKTPKAKKGPPPEEEVGTGVDAGGAPNKPEIKAEPELTGKLTSKKPGSAEDEELTVGSGVGAKHLNIDSTSTSTPERPSDIESPEDAAKWDLLFKPEPSKSDDDIEADRAKALKIDATQTTPFLKSAGVLDATDSDKIADTALPKPAEGGRESGGPLPVTDLRTAKDKSPITGYHGDLVIDGNKSGPTKAIVAALKTSKPNFKSTPESQSRPDLYSTPDDQAAIIGGAEFERAETALLGPKKTSLGPRFNPKEVGKAAPIFNVRDAGRTARFNTILREKPVALVPHARAALTQFFAGTPETKTSKGVAPVFNDTTLDPIDHEQYGSKGSMDFLHKYHKDVIEPFVKGYIAKNPDASAFEPDLHHALVGKVRDKVGLIDFADDRRRSGSITASYVQKLNGSLLLEMKMLAEARDSSRRPARPGAGPNTPGITRYVPPASVDDKPIARPEGEAAPQSGPSISQQERGVTTKLKQIFRVNSRTSAEDQEYKTVFDDFFKLDPQANAIKLNTQEKPDVDAIKRRTPAEKVTDPSTPNPDFGQLSQPANAALSVPDIGRTGINHLAFDALKAFRNAFESLNTAAVEKRKASTGTLGYGIHKVTTWNPKAAEEQRTLGYGPENPKVEIQPIANDPKTGKYRYKYNRLGVDIRKEMFYDDIVAAHTKKGTELTDEDPIITQEEHDAFKDTVTKATGTPYKVVDPKHFDHLANFVAERRYKDRMTGLGGALSTGSSASTPSNPGVDIADIFKDGYVKKASEILGKNVTDDKGKVTRTGHLHPDVLHNMSKGIHIALQQLREKELKEGGLPQFASNRQAMSEYFTGGDANGDAIVDSVDKKTGKPIINPKTGAVVKETVKQKDLINHYGVHAAELMVDQVHQASRKLWEKAASHVAAKAGKEFKPSHLDDYVFAKRHLDELQPAGVVDSTKPADTENITRASNLQKISASNIIRGLITHPSAAGKPEKMVLGARHKQVMEQKSKLESVLSGPRGVRSPYEHLYDQHELARATAEEEILLGRMREIDSKGKKK